MADAKPAGDLPPDVSGNEVVFGNRTIGWYKWAKWFSQTIFDSRCQSQLTSASQAFAILCKGDELGLPPYAAWSWIYQTKAGRLAIMSKGALAVVQKSPLFGGYEERIEFAGTDQMKGVAIAIRKGFPPYIKEFSLEQAGRAGLLREGRTRDGAKYETTYQNYLEDMLLARARGRVLDIAFAAELGGVQIEGVAEDADRAEENRKAARAADRVEAASEVAPPVVATAPRRDPLLVAVGRALPPADQVLDPAFVRVVPDEAPADAAETKRLAHAEADVEAIFGPAEGPVPETEVVQTKTGIKMQTPRATPAPLKKGAACPRCRSFINEMGGCDYCGYPGKDVR